MLNFTSSLYLDIKHSSAELAGWHQLTTGLPSALYESTQSKYVSNYIANMQGLQTGISATSTLHIYYDLFGFLSNQKIMVFVDEKIYPVSKYGIEKLIVKKIPVYTFKHLDAVGLSRIIHQKIKYSVTPVVLTDGFCPQCGKLAAIDRYIAIVKPYNGKIIIDDTQAFGILGKKKDDFLYGYGGGGTLQWINVYDKNIITIVSLAKAFGAPLAVISGNKNFITAFEKNSITRESSSPVSAAHLSAVNNAILVNESYGDEKRKKLFNNILLFRKELIGAGLQLSGGMFPVQNITFSNYDDMINLFEKLNHNNIKTVLTTSHQIKIPVITFIINATHSVQQIKMLAAIIKREAGYKDHIKAA